MNTPTTVRSTGYAFKLIKVWRTSTILDVGPFSQ